MDKTGSLVRKLQEQRRPEEAVYERPAMWELGTVGDLTWTGSADTYTIST